jgi:DNA end-binding protein Ku
MSEQRKVAIARFVMRNKESLAAIRANNEGTVLTLATMRFADEVVPPDQLDDVLGEAAEVEPRKREIDMAKALIDSLSSDFDPTEYKDEYREELMSLIERKAAGEKIVSPDAEAPKPTKAPDLMAALEESLAAIKGEDLGGGGEKRRGSNGGSKSKSKSSSSSSKSKSSSSSSSGSKSKSKSSSSGSRSKSSSKAKSKSKPRAKAAK